MVPDYFDDDIQGRLYDELINILAGKSNQEITDDHIASLNAEINIRWPHEHNNTTTESPF